MANPSENLLGRLSALSGQPAARQLGLLIGLAASIALGMGLVRWASGNEYTPLYGQLSPAATSELIQTLEADGTPYRYSEQTGMVSVPSDRVHQLRLNLASKGLPEKGGNGFSTLYKEQQMGVSSFIEKARYDRSLEYELADSIASLQSVKSARVHLAIPKQSAFVRKASQPGASVLLKLYAGQTLTDQQLAGITYLVASSVPGLDVANVSVVDERGSLLSSQGSRDGFGYTKEQFRYTQQLENSYVQRINAILTPILGAGAFRAQVTADVDFTRVEKTSESYAPERNVRSEELTEEQTASAVAEGVPGTLSNTPPQAADVSASAAGPEGVADQATPQPPTRSSKKEVRNFELGKTISHITETPGNLLKLSVAVVVDHRDQPGEDGAVAKASLTEQQLAEVNSLVREAVGFNQSRGDTVNVVSASFVAPPEFEALPEPSLMEQDWVWKIAKIVVAGLGMILLLFTVLRPLMQVSVTPAGPQQQLLAPESQAGLAPPDTGAVMGLSDDQVTLGQQPVAGQQMGLPGATAPGYQQQLNRARSMVEEQPERVAHVVKNWVAADG